MKVTATIICTQSYSPDKIQHNTGSQNYSESTQYIWGG